MVDILNHISDHSRRAPLAMWNEILGKEGKIDISHFRIIGSRVTFAVTPEEARKMLRGKTDTRGLEGLLLGHDGTKLYHVWVPSMNGLKRSASILIHETIPDPNQLEFTTRPNGVFRKPETITVTTTPPKSAEEVAAIHANTPLHPKQAVRMEPEWQNSMDKELDTIFSRRIFEWTDLPQGKRAIGIKWAYGIKTDRDGNETRKTSRLTVRGDQQTEGIDYDETFASTGRPDSWRVMLALARRDGHEVRQMNVVAAYLYGVLIEDVYLKPDHVVRDYMSRHPDTATAQGYTDDKYIRLTRSLYGLKQSGRCWQEHLRGILTSMGFKPTRSDPAVYTNSNVKVYTHVDDFIYTAASARKLDKFERDLEGHIKIEPTPHPNWLLGVRLGIGADVTTLDQ
ncbi:uncharacterized protein BROUX77_006481 [Berkeleyomyces rouxiae]|uniref:uncharacterized protein n=1 Tax=Berkeleyomyces rouxiae TaxID=2035830 RepID=UPI003B7FFA2A